MNKPMSDYEVVMDIYEVAKDVYCNDKLRELRNIQLTHAASCDKKIINYVLNNPLVGRKIEFVVEQPTEPMVEEPVKHPVVKPWFEKAKDYVGLKLQMFL